jgi:coenzyme F420-reducing hydrogenase gamma subunit
MPAGRPCPPPAPVVVLLALRACLTERLLFRLGQDRILSRIGARKVVEADLLSMPEGPVLATLVEGTVLGEDHVRALVRARARSQWLVACGDCAVSGGPGRSCPSRETAWERGGDACVLCSRGADPLHRGTPISRFVPVDANVAHCPIRLEELLSTLGVLAESRGRNRENDLPARTDDRNLGAMS